MAKLPRAPFIPETTQLAEAPLTGAPMALDAPGVFTPPAPPLTDGAAFHAASLPLADALLSGAPVPQLAGAEADLQLMTGRLSPPATSPIAAPLLAVQPFGTKGAATAAEPVVGEVFDRRYTIEALLTHPMPDVRQRAAEAKVAIHHGAADIGIKMRAAIDTARGAETRR